jgi:OOP family OmpA-OmpF porin
MPITGSFTITGYTQYMAGRGLLEEQTVDCTTRVAKGFRVLGGVVVLASLWVPVASLAEVPRAEGAAREGYLTRGDGTVVMTDYGECWHTPRWRPEHRVVGCDGVTAPVAEVAAVEPPPVAPVVPEVVEATVYFEFDRYNLDAEDEAAIAGLVARIPPNGYLSVAGHADRIGTDEYNQALSQRRADAVRDYLVSGFGIDPARIRVSAYGERRGVVECAADLPWKELVACFRPDRRVEMGLVPGP